MSAYRNFHEWVRKNLAPGVRLYLVVAFCIVCAIFYVSGKAFVNFKGTKWEWILAALGELGGVGVAAVVSGVILKILAIENQRLNCYVRTAMNKKIRCRYKSIATLGVSNENDQRDDWKQVRLQAHARCAEVFPR
jgi:hypothetical protein